MNISRRQDIFKAWVAPSFVTLLFAGHLLVILLNPDQPWGDPGIGWHLKSGEMLVQTHHIPSTDTYSFTAFGNRWIQYQWLFQYGLGWLLRWGEFPLVTASCAVVFALIPVLVYQRCVRLGSNRLIAFASSLAAYGMFLMHAYNRPLIFTYLFFAILIEVLDRCWEASSTRLHWVLIPVFMLWSNLHGGFAAGLLLVGVFTGIALLHSLPWGMQTTAVRTRRFLLILGICLMASLVNPQGWELHKAVSQVVGMKSVAHWQEFMSPDFKSGGTSVYLFEVMLLGLLFLMIRRRGYIPWTEIIPLLIFAHYALCSIRHISLFAIIATPLLARELTLLTALAPGWITRRLEVLNKDQQAIQGGWIQCGLLGLYFVWLSLSNPHLFRNDLKGIWLSQGASDYISQHKISFQRMFNSDHLGGSLIYEFDPDIKVFMDDRNDVYGDDFILKDYFAVLYGYTNWASVIEKYQITSAVLAKGTTTITLLESSPQWNKVYEDHLNVIFLQSSDEMSATPSQPTSP